MASGFLAVADKRSDGFWLSQSGNYPMQFAAFAAAIAVNIETVPSGGVP
jgi:hypothetical protein